MWHSEALQRVKKMPKMAELLVSAAVPDDKKQMPQVDETVIISRMKAYNSRLGKEKK